MSAKRYRSLLWLYPRPFRTEYGDDLVQHFADLTADRGPRAAWARTSLDLVVTVPRYRLENLMTEQRSATVLNLVIAALCVAGYASVVSGIGPGVVLVAVAGVLAVAQRSTLARSLRTPDSTRRRRRLTTAAVLGGVFALSVVSYARDIQDDHIGDLSLVIHNLVGMPTMIGALGFLVAGLFTPRSGAPSGPAAG